MWNRINIQEKVGSRPVAGRPKLDKKHILTQNCRNQNPRQYLGFWSSWGRRQVWTHQNGRLRGQDSNLEPSPYTWSITFVTAWTISYPCLPASRPKGIRVYSLYTFITCVNLARDCQFKGFPELARFFIVHFYAKLPYSTGSRSTIELPRNVKLTMKL